MIGAQECWFDINELIAAPVTYYDGRNNNWGAIPTETRHL
jgi:hypothetical protein